MQRFDPRYWCVNFNTTAAGSVICTADDALLVTCNFRTDADLIGLYWYSDDTYSHANYRYESNYDYSTTILDFDFVLTNIRALDAVNGPTLTINHLDGTVDYVRLSNYITSGTSSAGHVHLAFASVGSGWDGTGTIDWTTVSNLMLSLVNDSFTAGSGVALVTQEVGTIAISNITVTGPTLAQDMTSLAAHDLRMTDGYDDSYPQTPTRFIQQMYQLGYRDWYSIYIGISHHQDVIWDNDESRFVVNPSGRIINDATQAWFNSLLSELQSNGFTKVVISVSYEVVHYLMPSGWQQYDADGHPGLSGWSPPSEFITPSNTAPLNYLADVVKAIFALFPVGMTQYIQVGEPWWWDNSFTTHEPCFYDSYTIAAYTSETGLPVPKPYLTSTTQSTVGYENFLNWLAQKLGDSTHYIVNQVRQTYPDAASAILFYTPQIFSTPMLQMVNLPINSWSSPQWDILQVEDYEWVINGDWANHETTWTTAETTLGYPLNHIQYFSGFNLQASTSDVVWPNVYRAIDDAYAEGVSQVWVWARPEVFRDGIVWPPVPKLAMQSFLITETIIHSTPRLDDARHDEWLLMSPGNEASLPPPALWKQLRDSLGGFDDHSRVLPDPELSYWRNTGIYSGQNMFVISNRDGERGGLLAARAAFVGIINNIFARTPIAVERQNFIPTIYRSAPINEQLIWTQLDSSYPFEPPPVTEWDVQVYSLTERNRLMVRPDFQDVLLNGGTLRVLLSGIGGVPQRWSIWNYSAPGVGWDDNAWDLLTLGWDAIPDPSTLIQYVDQTYVLRSSYEIAVDTPQERDALVSPLITLNPGDRVLVRHDAMDFWAVWQWAGTPSSGNPVDGFVLIRLQYYRTDDFINYIDWYAAGYSANSPPIVSYDTTQDRELVEGPNPINLFVRIKDNGTGAWIWTQWDPIAKQWITVAIQNGTLELSSKLYDPSQQLIFGPTGQLFGWDQAPWDDAGAVAPWDAPEGISTPDLTNLIVSRDGSWEIRILADALRYGGLLLDIEINEIFFSMLHSIHAQQERQIDWAFHTSFMDLLGYDVPLQQTPFMAKDTTPDLISYISEVKPYRVKLREFSTHYNPDIDIAGAHLTDYDKPVYWDPDLNQYRVLDPNVPTDLEVLMTTKPWSDWYQAQGDGRVRSFDMTLLFDRITNEVSLGWSDEAWDSGDLWDPRDTSRNYAYLHTKVLQTLLMDGPTIQVDDVRWLRSLWTEDDLTPVSASNPLRVIINGHTYSIGSVSSDPINASITRGAMSGTLTTLTGSFLAADAIADTVVEAIVPQPSAARRINDYYVPTAGMPPEDLTLLLDLDEHGSRFSLLTTVKVESGTTLTFASTDGVLLGLPVFGAHIVEGAKVIDVGMTTVTLSMPITGTISAGIPISFGLPTLIDGYVLPAFTSSTAFDITGFDLSDFDVDTGIFDIVYDGGSFDPVSSQTDINPSLPNHPHGLDLRDPYFAANHPQERLPFTSDDGLQIMITSLPLVGGPAQMIKVFNVSGLTTSTATLFFDLIAQASDAVLVFRDGVRGTLGTDYSVDIFTRTISVNLLNGSKRIQRVHVHSFGFGGTSVIDDRYYYAFAGNPLIIDQTTNADDLRVVVDGTVLPSGGYTVSGNQVTLTTPPLIGADVAMVLFHDGVSTASDIQFPPVSPYNVTQQWTLNPVDTITTPEHGGTIVEVNGIRLRPPTTFYGKFTPSEPWMFLPTYPNATDTIHVFVDDVAYTTAIPFCTSTDPRSPYPFKLVVPAGQTPPTNIAGQFVFFAGLMVALDPTFSSNNVVMVMIRHTSPPDFIIDQGVLTIYPALSPTDKITVFSFSNANSMGWHTLTYDANVIPKFVPVPFSPNYALVAMDGLALAPDDDYEFDYYNVGWDSLPLDSAPFDITMEASEIVIKHPGGHAHVIASVCTEQPARELMQWITYTTTPAHNRMPPALDNAGQQIVGFPTHGSVQRPIPMFYSEFDNLRLSPYLAGKLAGDLAPDATEIVVDLLVRTISPKLEPILPLPAVFDGNPGVVWINGERIEYFTYAQTDQTATLSGLRRGTQGTSIQEQRNVTIAYGIGGTATYSVAGTGPVEVLIGGLPVPKEQFTRQVTDGVTYVMLTVPLGEQITLAITIGYTYSAGSIVYNGEETFTLPVPIGTQCGNRELPPMQEIIIG